jgi:hypothetical protein
VVDREKHGERAARQSRRRGDILQWDRPSQEAADLAPFCGAQSGGLDLYLPDVGDARFKE